MKLRQPFLGDPGPRGALVLEGIMWCLVEGDLRDPEVLGGGPGCFWVLST
jgi:hypothetical protein